MLNLFTGNVVVALRMLQMFIEALPREVSLPRVAQLHQTLVVVSDCKHMKVVKEFGEFLKKLLALHPLSSPPDQIVPNLVTLYRNLHTQVGFRVNRC